ncbi:hypothetical protein FC15_GL000083 [Lapidilactobacillus concavus DSM 17758]|uniref:Uncharacterized protein n=1 Tax=Lapidilactobacillus concavus DSM 17758 TaxID=1423735 RepID=A0A0R1VU48_9LACO|nr:hypothetical protein FC15_GL000083 [Lapidilactobacillus concavus DSM 17758]
MKVIRLSNQSLKDGLSRRAAYDQYQQIWKNKCQLCPTNHLVSWHYEIIKQDDQ